MALTAAAFLAAVAVHPHAANAAPKPAATASPSPSPSPSATPEPLDHAIPRLEAAVKADPTDKQDAIELAADYLQINRADLAIALTQKLIQGGTKTAQTYYFDGLANQQLGHQAQALADLEQAANLEPTNAGVLGTLTNLYLQLNRPADAERVAKRAITFNKNDENAALAYGSVLAQEQKFDEARQQYEAAATINPKDVRPVLLEAQTYQAQGALALASQLYDRAIAIDPKSIDALAGKARLQAAEHDVTGAIATFETLLNLAVDPADKVIVIDQEGAVYANEKMDGNADQQFRRALTAYPNVLAGHTAYGEYLASRNDRVGAEREFLAGEGPNRDQPDAVVKLGELYAQEKQFGKAIDQFKRLVEIAGNDPRSHLLLAASYAANNQFDKSRDEFKASYNLQHTSEALLGLGQADLRTRNYAECAQVYDAIDRGAPQLARQQPAILYSLGQCYEGAKQNDKARSTYLRLLSYLPPGSQAAGEVKSRIASLDHANQPARKPAAKPTASPKQAALAHKPKPSPTPTH
ncbi:MAG TPA: tetratricopeptide repeat protein [Candidatus Sulfotelmatobacter sp.]|nr:tetratricopeptide repeat protein [Candidatus Sulfotelmatobacter sp.]